LLIEPRGFKVKGAEYYSGGYVKQVPRPSMILVIGLGNPILGDDGVGWKVATEIQRRSSARGPKLEVDCVSVGGLSLMERMLGYERVVVIDAAQTGEGPVGSVHVYGLDELPDPKSGHTTSAHDASLVTSLRMAESMGEIVPSSVDIVTIEIPGSYEFSEELSPAVAASVEVAAQRAIALLGD
jgi:hydrogenase maturation protease